MNNADGPTWLFIDKVGARSVLLRGERHSIKWIWPTRQAGKFFDSNAKFYLMNFHTADGSKDWKRENATVLCAAKGDVLGP